MSSPPSKLFLSYSSSDTTLAAAFKAHLEKEISGLEVFMASESIEKGEDWESSVHSNLRESFASVSIITKKWQASRWCFAEWMAASVLGKHILPFVDINVDLRAELSKRQNIRFNKERPDFGSATEWISKLLKKQKADLTKSPIPWAFQYQSDDAELFCGREKEIDGIVSQLNSIRHSRDRGPLLVHGSSGSGKSALIRAGVYPMLLNDKAREPWVVATLFKTSKEPFDDLLKSLTQAIERIGISKAVVARSIRGISAATVVECVAGLLKGKPLVLIIDNLDRYLDDGNNQSERLFELLRSVISLESAYMIGVLRSDKIQRAAEPRSMPKAVIRPH